MRFGTCKLSALLLRRPAIAVGALSFALAAIHSLAQGSAAAARETSALVLTLEGTVEINRGGTDKWTPAKTNSTLSAGDSLRTGARSRATVRLSDLSVL